MMRLLLVLFIGFLTSMQGHSQLSLSINYNYLQANSWDRIMHMYNFSRPWQNNELTPLTHAPEFRAGWMIRIRQGRSFYLHPQIGFRQFNSSASNGGEELFVRLRNYSFQFDINFNPRAIFRTVSAGPIGTRFMMYVSPSFHLWRPYVEQNEIPFYSDGEEEVRPTTIGWGIGAGVAYRSVMLAKKFILSPKLGIRACPGVELEDFSNAIQGNNAARVQNKTNLALLWEGGIEIVWVFPRTKSGKGFSKPCQNC